MAKQVKIDTEADDEIAGTAGKAEIEQFAPAPKKEFPQAKNIAALRSPLMRSSNKLFLRLRKGWHQTWIDADDVEAVKDVYAFIRKPAKPEEEAGRESGEILKIREDRDHALVAMECPEALYQEHLKIMSAQSHSRYSDQNDTWQEYLSGKNRDLGSRQEHLQGKVTMEEGEEQLIGKFPAH